MAFKQPLDMPVVPDPAQFDRQSGNRLERMVFNHRLIVILLCAVMTGFLGWHALKLPVNTSFEKMIPQSHPYIQNYFEHREGLSGMGNALRISVENTEGDIFDKEYLLTLQKISDVV